MNNTADDIRMQREAEELEEPVEEASRLARKLGLDPYDVNYWIVDYDEMNELIAYGGFQQRYPHWRWGMQYDRQQKQGQFLGGKAFEIVNNDNPAHAFLQISNSLADQKAVITHVEAHSDFFANNEWFAMFSRDPNAASLLSRHADSVREYIQDPEIDRGEIERWIDHALCLEDNIDQHQPYEPIDPDDEPVGPDLAELDDQLDELELSEEVRRQVFDEEWLDDQRDDDEAITFPEEPERDILAFLREHGRQYDPEAGKAVEMEDWQEEILEILRREAYYFAPQKMTKVLNEGWACVAPDTPVFSSDGLVEMQEVVEQHTPVSDGDETQAVYDSNIIEGHDTVTVETRRGFELTGSNNHRIRRPDGSWIRLDELSTGETIEVSGGNGVWPDEYVALDWDHPDHVTLDDVAEAAGVSVWTVIRYRKTGRAERANAIERELAKYDADDQGNSQRETIRIPDQLDEQFGRFLGLFVGDGHLPSNSRHIGFTSGSRDRVEEFAGLTEELFGVEPTVSEQGSRWRVYAYSKNLMDFLTDVFDIPAGNAAHKKEVPDQIRRSPKSVVAEFIRGLMDADGYAGDAGAILSTKSEPMSRQVQLLLTNFGILSRRREQSDGCYHVHLTGKSAKLFAEQIGFGYDEKTDALRSYLDDLAWFEDELWTDEIVSITEGSGTVYDISVENTHRYAAAGLINHNSYWESLMMADENFAGADEFVTYADHMSKVLGSGGLNPYSLGLELWEYVENTENRRHVVEQLLRVEGITWRNFHDTIDFEQVLALLEPDDLVASVDPEALDAIPAGDPRIDYDTLDAALSGEEVDLETYPWKLFTYFGLAERHYSLVQPANRGYIARISMEELERISRYLFDDERYASVEEALDDVDYTVGWDRMREIRESHNDVTFIDEFLTQEFVDEHDYFTYEYMHSSDDYRATSTDYEDVKKKLMLQFTNFGKPTIAVADGNYRNRNELLLEHQYNGVSLDVEQAKDTLERVFELWGRPVALRTIIKTYDDHDLEVARRRDREPEPEETGFEIRYDGMDFAEEELDWTEVEHLAATDVDYDTKPDEWLA
ncbi:SpoVR family protein [Halobacteriales archaeon QS_4_66_20]|nr:MAG: SpoVR family protein [Halobacteriales archaeon QS_4_66_20]